ncbi:BON domain-containing protein [Streptomyces sirii]|uniref:BON domain-containing protein n=1 Tax=Streptomyces sirii TaxID=3127701 RepID=UPI003D3643E1
MAANVGRPGGRSGNLLGIVSRGGPLRVFLRKDDAIREEMAREVIGRTARLGAAGVTAEVVRGQVALHGTVTDPLLVPVLVRMCASVDGVVSVSEDVRVTAGLTTPA